jgi:hypothetical protein
MIIYVDRRSSTAAYSEILKTDVPNQFPPTPEIQFTPIQIVTQTNTGRKTV